MRVTTSPSLSLGRRTVIFLAASMLIFAAAVALQLSWEGGTAVPAAAAAKAADPVATWQARVERRPEDAGAYAGLGPGTAAKGAGNQRCDAVRTCAAGVRAGAGARSPAA